MSSDRFEQELRRLLLDDAPRDVPFQLYTRVARVSSDYPTGRRRITWHRSWALPVALAAAVVIAVGGFLAGTIRLGPAAGPAPSPGTPSPTPHPSLLILLTDGPLTSDGENGSYGQGLDSIAPGTPFVWSNMRLYNNGHEEAVIDSVELVGATPGLRVLGMGALPVTSFGSVVVSGQPAPDNITSAVARFPLVGASLPGDTTRDSARWTWAAFILSVPSNGAFRVDSVDVTYHVGTREYRKSIASSLEVCAGGPLVGMPGPNDTPMEAPQPTSTMPYCPFPVPTSASATAGH